MAKDRFKPRIAAKEMATHKIPGETRFLSNPVDSNAKLKITRTRTPNMIIDAKDSLLRNSIAMSLKTIAGIGFKTLLQGAQRHKGTKAQRKAANKDSLIAAFRCALVPLCLCAPSHMSQCLTSSCHSQADVLVIGIAHGRFSRLVIKHDLSAIDDDGSGCGAKTHFEIMRCQDYG